MDTDNKTVSESDKILIKKGREFAHRNFQQQYDATSYAFARPRFQGIERAGRNAPMKNIIDIMPMERDTIEFCGN